MSAAAAVWTPVTGIYKVIKDLSSTYVVVPGAVAANGGCAAQYGDTVVLA